ncbi:hypothetical protein BDK88_4258 [Natrinema hispanicum]|uniref:Uncharacterized protein n=1 Tax=Natrinema hispanicum TaxID=392421 RepID=A0A482Y360_9EURY|nr:hypothetical protein BDK88_4258 [Natrinema hispanicum]
MSMIALNNSIFFETANPITNSRSRDIYFLSDIRCGRMTPLLRKIIQYLLVYPIDTFGHTYMR